MNVPIREIGFNAKQHVANSRTLKTRGLKEIINTPTSQYYLAGQIIKEHVTRLPPGSVLFFPGFPSIPPLVLDDLYEVQHSLIS